MVKKRILKLVMLLTSIVLTIFLLAVTLYISTQIIVRIHYANYEKIADYGHKQGIIYNNTKYIYSEELSRMGYCIDYDSMVVIGYSVPRFMEWDPCASYEYRISESLANKLICKSVWVWIYGGPVSRKEFYINEASLVSEIIIDFYGIGKNYESKIPPTGTISVNYTISLHDVFQNEVDSIETIYLGNLYGLVGDDIYMDICLRRDYFDNYYVEYDLKIFKLPDTFSRYLDTIIR